MIQDRFVFLVLLIVLLPHLCWSQSPNTPSSIAYHDDWCRSNCATLQQCTEIFVDDFVELRVRVSNFSSLDGPGETLTNGIFLGDSISRQTFHTNFILDVASSLDISPCRLYITAVSPERKGKSWDSDSVFVTFRLFPVEIFIVRELTAQIQNPLSTIYHDKAVSSAIDPLYGLVATKWDFTLKLLMDISIVGQDSVKNSDELRYLNQGGVRWCFDKVNSETAYCQFELYFKADLANALSIQTEMVDVLFVKPEGEGSVIVTFRFAPSGFGDDENVAWIDNQIASLIKQISNHGSPLYQGNVTFRVDPTRGVSNEYRTYRASDSKYNVRSVRRSLPEDFSERCKATHRCSRGWNNYNQSTAQSTSTMQSFAGGKHESIPLFADFEQWQQGTRGWKWSCSDKAEASSRCIPRTPRLADYTQAPPGAHWSPFDFAALGPNIPSFNTTSNSGLVLNSASLEHQITQQALWIDRIREYIDWLDVEMNVSSLDATTRSRSDIQTQMTRTKNIYSDILEDEEAKLGTLSQSQCTRNQGSLCSLLFNTSNLEMNGAINATGVVATTRDGTEVAVWAFDSIDLDDDVHVVLTGQRAMALVSRSSVRINTALTARPGTLGGFPGGYSVSRRKDDRLVSVCGQDIASTNLIGDKCFGDQSITLLRKPTSANVVSNNINGPGSASVRVYLKTIETKAHIVDRVQSITIDADPGQTLSGGFKLQFNGYSTPFIPHDATARDVKEAIEDSLNPTELEAMDKIDRTDSSIKQGVGAVSIQRQSIGTSGGCIWTVRYDSAAGKHGNLTATDLLQGNGSFIEIQTLTEGNTIGGSYALSFLGDTTRAVPHDISANELERVLIDDIAKLEGAHVLRTDPTNKCDAGLCRNGPARSGGYIWTLTLTTNAGNISPGSITSNEFDNEGDIAELVPINNLTGCAANDDCPKIIISDGHGQSPVEAMKKLEAARPFSLAYGGSGGSHGGRGGQGFWSSTSSASELAGEPYGDEGITGALYGGSGGALGLTKPFEIIMFDGPRARGGSGGGAIEIVAANDIFLGPRAILSCDGQEGFSSFMTGGGGGSGGTVLLSAGGAIHHNGTISANGGPGGRASRPDGRNDLDSSGHGAGGGGGRIAMYAESIVLETKSTVTVEGGRCPEEGAKSAGDSRTGSTNETITSRMCSGEEGTFRLEARLEQRMHIDYNEGAAGSKSSLRLKASKLGNATPELTPYNRTLSILGGPEFDFGGSTRPGRVSFFVRTVSSLEDGVSSGTTTNTKSKDWAARVELRSKRWSEMADADAENTRPGESSNSTAFIGIHIGRDMKHGANTRALPFDSTHLNTMKSFLSQTRSRKWYKIDIRLDWNEFCYDIFLDDTLVVRKATFVADGMEVLSIANFDSAMDVWIDEIFVGNDTTMGFRCPFALAPDSVSMERPNRRGWKDTEIGGTSSLHSTQRHESHISRRALYQRQEHNAVIVPNDGAGHNAFTSDVKFRIDADNLGDIDGNIFAGSLLQVRRDKMPIEDVPPRYYPQDQYTKGQPPQTYVWYGEHDNSLKERNGYYSASDKPVLHGGVAACSTEDFVSWKNEGIMLHYTNLTDMVRDSAGDGPYHIERPRVLYNNSTDKYVMWMIIDNEARDLAMAGIAVSDYATGPFDFVRSFYPDGNQTRDQTLVQDPNGTAYLIRSYYATVEFVLPSAIMQPTWESVKDFNGDTDFALTYHRAHYEPQYDDYHDIYLQRWRTEDKPWKVVCVDRMTGSQREVPFGKENLNFDEEVCNDPYEYKRVIGQGNPTQNNTKDGIPSRFLNPNDPANNAWTPNSVPGVKAQPWSANYKDGSCGIRHMDDDMDHLDPSLPARERPDRGSCSNIADNPIHQTAPDKLIGKDRIVESRRAKFVAISPLTDDYLETNGVLTTFEGELEEGADLISLIDQAKQGASTNMPFGWNLESDKSMREGMSQNIGSTYIPQEHSPYFRQADDWDTRYHQYRQNFNDRASYSIACLIDGTCPVNFKDQISEGHS